jgi:anti-sigma B factor antagonist
MMTQADTPKVEENGTVRVITLTSGILLEEDNVLASELEGRTDGLGGCHLMLDFTHVERINSVELGTLITLHKSLKAAGGRLTLFNLSTQVFEVFAVTRLDTFLCICREKAGEPDNWPPGRAAH